MIGQEVLGYRVKEFIGKGSFASVYKVQKENESGTYTRALKHIVIPEQSQYLRIWNSMGRDTVKTDQYFEQIFHETMQEIRLLHAFTDSGIRNIVACYENDVVFHESPKRYEIFILMEYLTPLSKYIEKYDLTLEEVFDCGQQILDALEVCHKNHIIHRDVKEDNIFLAANGVYKLGDFGVAKIHSCNNLASSMKGTAEYMAPEVLRHTEEYDETVDIYSLGIVLYRLMNHMRSPFLPTYPSGFDAEDEERAMRRRLNNEPLPMPDAAPMAMGKVILKALAPKNQRFQNVEDFRNCLQRAKNTLNENELMCSVMTGKVITTDIDPVLENMGTDHIVEKKARFLRKLILIILVCVLLISSGTAYRIYQRKQMRIRFAKWEKNTIFPFATISMDMKESDFKYYYGSRLTKGNDEQYYLELQSENTRGYVTIIFEKGSLTSANYSFHADEEEWFAICKSFYQDENIENQEWPFFLIKNEAQIMLDYDEDENQACIFISSTEE